MRIGLVTAWLDRGSGMVSRAYRDVLSPAHEVRIFARGGDEYARGDPRWDTPEVTWSTRVPGATLNALDFGELADWVRRHRIELLFFNEQNHWPSVVLARRELGIPLGSYVDYYKANTVPFFRLYDFLVCNTRRHQKAMAEHPRAHYVPWGTDLGLFPPRLEPVSPGSLVFFHSAGYVPDRKGTVPLLRAFARVTGRARLVVHIQKPPASFPALAALAGADPRVELVVGEYGAPGLYHRGDVYVYPTRLEGIGLTIAEALASGLPVITTDAPPMNEMVVAGPAGSLVRVDEYRGRADGYFWPEALVDEAALAAALQDRVDHLDRLPGAKAAARDHAARALDWHKNAAGLPALFESMREAPRGREDLAALEQQALDLSYVFRPFRRVMFHALGAAGLARRPAIQRWIYS